MRSPRRLWSLVVNLCAIANNERELHPQGGCRLVVDHLHGVANRSEERGQVDVFACAVVSSIPVTFPNLA